jgi:hypothetical protein
MIGYAVRINAHVHVFYAVVYANGYTVPARRQQRRKIVDVGCSQGIPCARRFFIDPYFCFPMTPLEKKLNVLVAP